MKTQITNLINGSRNVIRDLTHAKYATAIAVAGSSSDFIGTSRFTRASLAELVRAENESREFSLHVNIRGVDIILSRCKAGSRETFNYVGDLTEAQYLKITGYFATGFIYEASFSIIIYHDLTVCAQASTRKSPLATWKHRRDTIIGEEFVEIL